jgi:hypothetical protein
MILGLILRIPAHLLVSSVFIVGLQ